jgi:aryl-alcohol dehydrogenase
MKIRAAVAWEAGATLSIEEFDLDDPRDDEILVKVEAVGVCHTDDNARLGRLPVVFPIILGHEGAGTVERVGKGVTKVRPGDRVLFTPDYCGKCEQCVLSKMRPGGRGHVHRHQAGRLAACSLTSRTWCLSAPTGR